MTLPSSSPQPDHLYLVSPTVAELHRQMLHGDDPDEYVALRAQISDTAASLYVNHLDARKAFHAAFAIVGEDIAETTIRKQLRYFYLGHTATAKFRSPQLNINNATTRAFVTLRPHELPERTVPFYEPRATYLARQALGMSEVSLAAELEPRAESNAGALFRAFIAPERPYFTQPEAEHAVKAMMPLVAPDIQQTLRIGYEDYQRRQTR